MSRLSVSVVLQLLPRLTPRFWLNLDWIILWEGSASMLFSCPSPIHYLNLVMTFYYFGGFLSTTRGIDISWAACHSFLELVVWFASGSWNHPDVDLSRSSIRWGETASCMIDVKHLFRILCKIIFISPKKKFVADHECAALLHLKSILDCDILRSALRQCNNIISKSRFGLSVAFDFSTSQRVGIRSEGVKIYWGLRTVLLISKSHSSLTKTGSWKVRSSLQMEPW
jgi:hypothetical protein